MASLGMPLDDWQEQALEAAMGERSDGRWASRFVGLSVPRQNGKSQLIVARALAGVLLFGEKMIIISAHEADAARLVWTRLVDVVEDNPSLLARVTGRMDAINREFMSFGRGLDRQTIKVKARRKSGSRGFSADCLLLDEGQILGKDAWGSIVPTMSAMPNPQLWLFGTPPTEGDDPFAFTRVRESAKARKARHCWLEWSADDHDDLDDPEVWAKANPAFGIRISLEACADDRAAMDDAQFARERLGMWSSVSERGVIPYDAWQDRVDPKSFPVDSFALGVEVGPDLATASISVAGQREDGDWHVQLEERRNGGAWVTAYVSWLVEANPQIRAVVVDVAGPIQALLEQTTNGKWRFRGTKVAVTPLKSAELASACSRVLDGTVTGWLRHVGQPEMDTAVKTAGKRAYQNDSGMWVFSRKTATADITPVQSATYALWGAQNTTVKRPSAPSKGRRVKVL